MEDKLVLGLPDSQAAIAPMKKHAITERKEGRKKLLLFPALLFGAFGAVFSKMQPEAQELPEEQPEEEEAPPSDLEVIENVAAFLQAMGGNVPPAGEGTKLASVRISFEDSYPSQPSSFSSSAAGFRGITANDNGRGVIGKEDNFEFPPLSPPGKGSGGGNASAGPDDDRDPSDDNKEPPDDDDKDPPDDGGGDPDANRAPVALGRHVLSSGMMNLSALILLDDLLTRVYDPDGDALSIENITVSSGAIRAYGDDMWLYTPERGEIGEVTFTYTVTDGEGWVQTSAVLDLLKPPPREIRGTEGDDVLIGTPQEDIIAGLGGNDIIHAREDNDVVFGGAGDDRLIGSDGDDILYGDAGNDYIAGGAGNDVLFGGRGNDRLFGDEGKDVLIAGSGNDELYGGADDDRLFGEDGDDALAGEGGHDVLDGGAGNDVLAGGSGDDAVSGGEGSDVIRAGFHGEEERAGAALPDDGDDIYSGGKGFDTYDAGAAQHAVVVDLSAGTATGEDIGNDRLESIEAAVGGAGDDLLTGNDGDNRIEGGDGEDRLTGGDGDDHVSGGAGDDVVLVAAHGDGGAGDQAPEGDGDDIYSGGDGIDTLDLTALVQEVLADLEAEIAEGEEIGKDSIQDFETVIGGGNDDRISGDSGNNLLAGGDGDDRLSGRGGDDVLVGGNGDDIVSGDGGNDVVLVAVQAGQQDASDGNDTYRGGEGCDTYNASSATQTVVIDLAQGTASGQGVGQDVLDSFEAAIGGSGADILIASNALNFLAGGSGADVFVFRSVDAVRNGGCGRDEIRDFGVGDRIDFSELASEVGGLVLGSLMEEAASSMKRLTFHHETFDDGERTIVRAVIDFERDQDIEILLYGRHELTAEDFILAALESVAREPADRG
ncbi:MAG: cadherin-like domain-containing protein [Shinella sp.]|nr:cadherin-like domain-containing protein [Shinella sp.]